MTVHEWLRSRLLQRAGLAPAVNIDALRASEWSGDFERLMRNRLVLGALRYGPLRGPLASRYDSVGSARERLARYASDGNLEHLVDAANLCLVEFVRAPSGRGCHPAPHWTPADDGEHTREL